MKEVFTFKIGGAAGYGIMSSGLIFSKVATRSGLSIFDYVEYPSLIRGGHNVVQISISEKTVRSQRKTTDFLVALNQETINLHKHELSKGAGVIYDKEQGSSIKSIKQKVEDFPIPIRRLAIEAAGSVLMKNTVALGAALYLLGGDIKSLTGFLKELFAKKGSEIVKKNQKAALAGYNFAKKHYQNGRKNLLKPRKSKAKIVVSANEAIALGALAAGVQFVAIYPMTPISNILHTLAPLQEKFGFCYQQPEDEISGINMAIGASFAGARSMVATSGGGFCLMTEAYGLAGITETPLVIIEGMRGAPATGLPTWTEQGDLRFVLHAHQGEFPRIVLAPGDAEEAFYLTMEAFNLAEIYQTPVVVLVDKYICESHQSTPPFNYENYKIDRGKLILTKKNNYLRYKIEKDGISWRTIPGVGNYFVANSDEHNEIGYSCEDSGNRIKQMQKRMKKLETCRKNHLPKAKLFGPKKADLTVVSWGSNKGPILDAIENFDNVNFLHINWINPFPVEEVKKILSNSKYIVNVECNYSGQMASIIREKTGIDIKDKLLKYDGRPFYPEEISEKIAKTLKKI
jgi:2-oxoglutarate ferredoxin oxidoreductase subunit alpha